MIYVPKFFFMKNTSKIAIIGGGPAALLMLKHLLKMAILPEEIYIFEKNKRFGVGMPYSEFGATEEHIANVSANELPEMVNSFKEFYFEQYKESYNENKVLPRLLLGDYLENQFEKYLHIAKQIGVKVIARKNTPVLDIIKNDEIDKFEIITNPENDLFVDKVIVSTGHVWPKTYEDKVKGWYDSPYPPNKFKEKTNCIVAIRGTSLTAIDAVKTIARLNGKFVKETNGDVKYIVNKDSEKFKIHLFSTSGFLPALRFHTEDETFSSKWIMSLQEIYDIKQKNDGFVPLDTVFEYSFKRPLREKDPKFYEEIKDLTIKEFVDKMLEIRKEVDSFDLFEAEYKEAQKSIKNKESITWKETIYAFSYAMNYPAKHFSAEDMLRLQKTLMPLISVIIAALPQSSYHEIMALYKADLIDLIQVDKNSTIEPDGDAGVIYSYKSVEGVNINAHYDFFIDAIGQKKMNWTDFPFDGLRNLKLTSPGFLDFKDEKIGKKMLEEKKEKVVEGYNHNYYLEVSGLGINDYFQSINIYKETIPSVYIMTVPFIGGLNPDYSGLDFCDTAGERIAEAIVGG